MDLDKKQGDTRRKVGTYCGSTSRIQDRDTGDLKILIGFGITMTVIKMCFKGVCSKVSLTCTILIGPKEGVAL
jgi:hypothetical protein